MIAARVALAVALAATAGCYDPDLRDCAITCKVATDCAGDQTCGSAGLCVGSTATTCKAGETPDAKTGSTTTALHITVDGKGGVTVDGKPAMTCVAQGNAGDCTYEVTTEVAHALVAMPMPGRSFTAWSGGCSGSATTCTMTPTAAVTVGAKFDN